MEVRVEGSATWRQLNAKFRAAANGKIVRKALTKSLQASAKPAVRDVKVAVMKVKSQGHATGGLRKRRSKYRAKHPKGRVHAHGLRETIARLVTSRMKYSGLKVGLEVRVRSAEMPNGQRRLPYYLDGQGRWRHPTFGNRHAWVTQTGQPYFEKTLEEHTPRVRQDAINAVTTALKELK